MSLISAAKMSSNTEFRERVGAAIRQVAYGKLGFDGPVGQLADAGMTAPETVAAPFLWELSADPTVTDKACPQCGHSQAADDQVRYVIETKWDAVAGKLYPAPGV